MDDLLIVLRTPAVACSAWLGVIDYALLGLCIFIPIVLTGLVGLLYMWCALCRTEPTLREELPSSKLKQAEDERKKYEANGKPFQPSGEHEQPLRHGVQLRRKAFLLRRNADKLDHLLFKPIRLLLGVIGKPDIKRGSDEGEMASALAGVQKEQETQDVSSRNKK